MHVTWCVSGCGACTHCTPQTSCHTFHTGMDGSVFAAWGDKAPPRVCWTCAVKGICEVNEKCYWRADKDGGEEYCLEKEVGCWWVFWKKWVGEISHKYIIQRGYLCNEVRFFLHYKHQSLLNLIYLQKWPISFSCGTL